MKEENKNGREGCKKEWWARQAVHMRKSENNTVQIKQYYY